MIERGGGVLTYTSVEAACMCLSVSHLPLWRAERSMASKQSNLCMPQL